MDHLSLRQRSKETRQVLPEAVRGLKTRVVFGAITLMNFFLKCFQAFGMVVCVLLGCRALRNLLWRKRKYFRALVEGVWW